MAKATTNITVADKKPIVGVKIWQKLIDAIIAINDNTSAVYTDAAGKLPLSSATVAAAGTTIADATALTEQVNVVTGADGTKGVQLPVAAEDSVVVIINSDTSNDLLVYPVLLSQINALGASNAFTIEAGQTATFVGRSIILWNTAEMPNTVAGLTASGAELNVLDGVTAGTVTASKGVVVDANKDVSAFRNVGVVNLDAGSDGVVGTIDVFPATAANGKLTITCTDQGAATDSILDLAAQTQANTITLPDVNLAASFVALSTNALTAAQVDVLETLTATAAELNKSSDLSAQIEIITTSGAQAITAGVQAVYLNENTTAIASTIATSVAHQGMFLIKAGLEPAGGQDHTCVISTGSWDGTNQTATFADLDDFLLVYFDAAGAGTILVNNGSVALS